MKKMLFAVLAVLFAAVSAFAAETKMDIVQVKPGVVDLKLTNVAGVWLINRPDTSKKKYAVTDKTDEAGKGKADVVFAVTDPQLYDRKGDLFCFTGVGPAWARGKSKFDTAKMPCADVDGAVTVRLTVPQANFGSTFGVAPVIVNKDGTLHAWGSHPFGDTRFIMERPNATGNFHVRTPDKMRECPKGAATCDVITLLTAEKDGNIRPATEAEAADYQARVYAKIF